MHVRGNIYMLSAGGVNIALSVGPEGILMVDSGPSAFADRILAAVQKLSTKPIRYILDTNADSDHAGNNSTFEFSSVGFRLASVPEPSSFVLIGFGCWVLASKRRRRF